MEIRPFPPAPDDLALRVADGVAIVVRSIFFWVAFVIRFAFILFVALVRQLSSVANDPRTRRLLTDICDIGSACWVCTRTLFARRIAPTLANLTRPSNTPIIVHKTVTIETVTHTPPEDPQAPTLPPPPVANPPLPPTQPAATPPVAAPPPPNTPDFGPVDEAFLAELDIIDPVPPAPVPADPLMPTDIPIIGLAGQLVQVGAALFEPDTGLAGNWFAVIVGRSVGVYQSWTRVGPMVIGVRGNVALSRPSREEALACFMQAYELGNVHIVA